MPKLSTEQAIALYQQDKLLGKRLSNGAKPLKKITLKHRLLIALFVRGYSNNEVALQLKMTPSWVSTLRHDPKISEIIDRHIAEADEHIAALMPKVAEKLSQILDSSDNQHVLGAIDKVLKTQAKYKEAGGDQNLVTAEDVARQIIEVKGEARITLEQGTRIAVEKVDEGG